MYQQLLGIRKRNSEMYKRGYGLDFKLGKRDQVEFGQGKFRYCISVYDYCS